MLILARRLNETLIIGDGIEVKVVGVQGSGDQATVRLGVVAPQHVRIWRKEVYDQVVAENRQALASQRVALTQPLTAADQREQETPEQRSMLANLVVRPGPPADQT